MGGRKGELSPKARAFCLAYMNLKKGKAAAIKAGYSAKTAESQASQLLRNVKVAEYIKQLNAKVETKAIITKQRVLDELAILGFSDMKDCVTIGAEGQIQVKTFDEMPEGASRAISGIKEKRSIRQSKDDSEDMIIDLQLEYKHHDKVAALKEISKLSGFYPEEGTGETSVRVQIVKFGDTGKA